MNGSKTISGYPKFASFFGGRVYGLEPATSAVVMWNGLLMILLMIPRTTLIQNYELVFSSSSRRRVGDFRNSALSIRDFLLTSAGEKSNDNVVGRNPVEQGVELVQILY